MSKGKSRFKEESTMKYICQICGWEYDEKKGDAEAGIAPGTKWEDLPRDFICPPCRAAKSAFAQRDE
jgi:rubredoxin-NAD+ reductase